MEKDGALVVETWMAGGVNLPLLVGVGPDADAPHPMSAAAMDEVQQRIRAETGAQVIC